MGARDDRVGIVKRGDLDVDLVGENRLAGVEQRRSAPWAEVPPSVLGLGIFLGLALDLQIVLLH